MAAIAERCTMASVRCTTAAIAVRCTTASIVARCTTAGCTIPAHGTMAQAGYSLAARYTKAGCRTAAVHRTAVRSALRPGSDIRSSNCLLVPTDTRCRAQRNACPDRRSVANRSVAPVEVRRRCHRCTTAPLPRTRAVWARQSDANLRQHQPPEFDPSVTAKRRCKLRGLRAPSLDAVAQRERAASEPAGASQRIAARRRTAASPPYSLSDRSCAGFRDPA